MREIYIVASSLLAQTISFCLSYIIFFKQTITHKKWKLLVYICLIVIVHGVLLHRLGGKASYDYSMFTQVLVPIFLIEDRKVHKYFQYLFISVATPLLGIVPLNIIALIQSRSINYYLKSPQWLLSIEIAVMAIMILVYIITRKNDIYKVNVSGPGYTAMMAVVGSSLIFIACVQELSKIYSGELLNAIGLASSIACLVPVIVVIWLIRTEQKRNELEIQNRLSNELLIMQKNYNNSIIDSNDQIRRFRHDFKGHIRVMQEYCREANIDKMQEYLNNMVEDSLINHENKYTGNMEVDAILAPLVRRCEAENIKIDIKGFLPKDIDGIDIYDICSIFFNLMNNAVEESERILPSRPWVKIETAVYNGLFRLLIENSAQGQKDTKKIQTQKADTREHGIGLGNVKRVVEKYNGQIDIKSTTDTYSVEIMI